MSNFEIEYEKVRLDIIDELETLSELCESAEKRVSECKTIPYLNQLIQLESSKLNVSSSKLTELRKLISEHTI